MADNDEELKAIQASFDEYIASSRELEEELENEINKLQDKLAESSQANTVLTQQLQSYAPQLAALEQQLNAARDKLHSESQFRRTAEMEAENLETKLREVESSLMRSHEEAESAVEELGLLNMEYDELKYSSGETIERLRVEIEELKSDIVRLRQHQSGSEQPSRPTTPSITLTDDNTVSSFNDNQDDDELLGDDDENAEYIKQLEDELEVVTEELITLQNNVNDLTSQLADMTSEKENANAELAEITKKYENYELDQEDVQDELSELKNKLSHIKEENLALNEELELTGEELVAVHEQLELVEKESKDKINEFEKIIESLKKEVTQLKSSVEVKDNTITDFKIKLDKAFSDSKSYEDQVSMLRKNLEVLRNVEDECLSKDSSLIKLQRQLDEIEVSACQEREQLLIAQNDLKKSEKTIEDLEKEVEKLVLAVSQASTTNSEDDIVEQLQTKVDMLKRQCNTLTDCNSAKDREIEILHAKVKELQSAQPKLPVYGDASAATVSIDGAETNNIETIFASKDFSLISAKLQELAVKYESLQKHNAFLLGKILSLQGNIQVCCRIRPILSKEESKGYKTAVEPIGEAEVGCFDSKSKQWKSFAFDRVWASDFTQSSVFQDVEPLALSVVDGYNVCIFAYGQTGSGKTFTMEGKGDQYGISFRMIQKIFNLLQEVSNLNKIEEEDKSEEFKYSVRVGMLEIYNDEVYDLLSSGSDANVDRQVKSSLDIRRAADGHMEVPGSTSEEVKSLQDVTTLLKRGNSNRATASTNMNDHSSRSHMVLQVEVTSQRAGQPQISSKLTLCDLAGSERVRKSGVQGSTLKEAQHINKSLSALGDVMEALDRKASHIPFRNSKLTYLLQDSLGGNSRTMMVLTVCPTSDSYDESFNALQFATRVRRINIGAAKKNVQSKNLEETLKNVTKEMKLLQTAKARTEEQLISLRRDHQRIQERLTASQEMRSQNRDESRTIGALQKNTTDLSLRLQKEKEMRYEKVAELEQCQKDLHRVQQQLSHVTRDNDSASKKLSEQEEQIKALKAELRNTKDALSEANVRVRTTTVLKRPSSQGITTKKEVQKRAVTKSSSIPRVARLSDKKNSTNSYTTKRVMRSSSSTKTFVPPNSASSSVLGNSNDDYMNEIRRQVRDILQKHDESKVEKIDDLMNRFKGKEMQLLTKLKSRYESSQTPLSPEDKASAVKRRTELAMERHAERMRLIRDKKSAK